MTDIEVLDIPVRLCTILKEHGIDSVEDLSRRCGREILCLPKIGPKALESIEGIKRELEGVNTVCGLSNISFALPKRPVLNRAFLTLAMRAGLSAVIIDPLDKRIMGNLHATEVLLGQDEYCIEYIKAFREGRLED